MLFQYLRNAAILLTILAGFSDFSLAQSQTHPLTVLTYNIRYANPEDAPNTWAQRKEKVFGLIREAKPDVFGLQEALIEQVLDVGNAFSDYKFIGVGRDDGKKLGEYSPLFFNSEKYTLMESGTFWLSQTPSVPGSRGWDAACNRVVTWVHLKENTTGKPFVVFCTHFDHIGEIARRNSANLLLQALDSLAKDKTAIVLGDFNATPDSEPYQIITSTSDPKSLTDAGLIDKNYTGLQYTYCGFKVGGLPCERIDYIFVKNIYKVDSYKVNPANNGTYYPSDHLPVSARIFLE
jgi:endonuclease/exonuclease/phosphatase family metal-dependent hydrolase